MKLACPECGHRQDAGDRCGACGYEGMLDLANDRHVDLLRDIETRLRDKRDTRVRIASVVFGVAVVFALWLVPGYWSLRGVYYPGLWFYSDQIIIMIVLALGMTKLLSRTAPPPRFPYLDDT